MRMQPGFCGPYSFEPTAGARWSRVATLIAYVITLSACLHSAMARELRIEHVTVVSAERSGPLRDATVVVRNERISSVTAALLRASRDDIEVIDGTNLFLSPGLIDSHVHTNELAGMVGPMEERFPEVARALRTQRPRSYLYFGFTTLVDVISTPEHLREWNDWPVHPDLYFCGATPIPGGYPPTYRTEEEQARTYPYMLVEGTHTPAAVVKKMKTDGAVCVKAFFERGFGEVDVWPVPRLETIRALVEAAHAAHMPVLIHANSTEGQKFALDAGADIVAHGLWHWNGEPQATELTARAKGALDGLLKANVGWQATMRVLAGDRDLFNPEFLSDARVAAVVPPAAIEWYRSDDGQWSRNSNAPFYLSKAVLDSGDRSKQWDFIRSSAAPLIGPAIERGASAVRYMAAHHARFLFGSDTPGSSSYANQPGLNGWLEMRLLVEAGLTSAQVFRAATLTNAEALGLTRELGTVQVGKRANLLLTRRDPSQSVQAYDEITKIILGGRVLDRTDLAVQP
jgi:imidazolonepropionase-like amidohydrolase